MKLHHRTLQTLALMTATSAALWGCGDNSETGSGGGTTTKTSTDTTEQTGGGGSGGANTGGGQTTTETATPTPEPLKRKTISGDVTWDVTFDDAAIAAGATNCSYTRHYTAVEDRSAKWLCPSCEIMFNADVELTAGLTDCFSQISSSTPAAKEWLGYGGGVWYRGVGGPMTDQGTVAIDMNNATTQNQVLDLEAAVGGFFQFDVAGKLTLGDEEGDPFNGFVPPETYACGWPKANPAEYTGDYVLKEGGIMPDALLKDKCGETVRLHDFKGAYLIVDMAAIDCPPCQSMASDEEAFIANMKAQGIDVHVVTALAPSLSNVLGNTTPGQLKSWTTKYNLASPVLADRGFGLSIFEPAIGADQIGYPSWAIVNPDLKVLYFVTGYGSFAEAESIILADSQ